MSDRFFLDTNIFVYSFSKDAPKKADRPVKLIWRAIERPHSAILRVSKCAPDKAFTFFGS